MIDINIVILGCALVTFIPRLIPAIFVDKLNFGSKVEKFLNLIPYTALAALICPGVLTVDNQLWYIGLIGAVVAAGLSWKKDCSYSGDCLFNNSDDLDFKLHGDFIEDFA